MNRIEFKNGSWIETIEPVNDSQDDIIIFSADGKSIKMCRESNPNMQVITQRADDYEDWAEIKRRIVAPNESSGMFNYEFYGYSPSPVIYNTADRNIDLFNQEYEEIDDAQAYREATDVERHDNLLRTYEGLIKVAGLHTYKEEDNMRVLFVRPEKYDAVCEWYERMDEVQKHRKVVVICKSPAEFSEKFDRNKFGASYTMFYFDNGLGPAKKFEYCKEFARLYNEDDTRYICKNKMRSINVDDLIYRNTFDWFAKLSVEQDSLERMISSAQKPMTCRSLL